MFKFTKIIALLLVATLCAVSFTACGGTPTSETIKIGGIGPLTDTAATYGLAVQHGAELAIKEINDNGGINGKMLEFQMQDDVADGEKSVTAYNNLKDWGMQILMGTVTTGACLSVIDKTKEDNMFELTPSASGADVIKNDNCFQICFTDPNQGKVSADYIADNKLATKVAIIYDSSDAYSTGIYNTFKTEATQKGLTVVSDTSFTKDSKTDFSAQISAAKSKGAELVFLPIYYNEASLILQEAKKQEFTPKFFGCDGLDGLLTIPNFDTKLAEGVMLLTPFAADATDSATTSFVEAFKAAYSETPNQFAADAYDAIKIIAKLAENGEVTPDMSVADICEKMKSGITASDFSYDGLTGLGMKWDATGAVSKSPKAVEIKSGAYASLEK